MSASGPDPPDRSVSPPHHYRTVSACNLRRYHNNNNNNNNIRTRRWHHRTGVLYNDSATIESFCWHADEHILGIMDTRGNPKTQQRVTVRATTTSRGVIIIFVCMWKRLQQWRENLNSIPTYYIRGDLCWRKREDSSFGAGTYCVQGCSIEIYKCDFDRFREKFGATSVLSTYTARFSGRKNSRETFRLR